MSDTYKWGTWCSIETAMDEDGCPPDGDVLLWVDPGPWGPAVWHGDASDWKSFKKDYPEAKPTHWMPPPPSPDEMAAARSLPDYRAPEHGGLHASALPSVKWNLAPEEMTARPSLEAILRKEMREAEEDKLPQVKNYLIQILKEAGLE